MAEKLTKAQRETIAAMLRWQAPVTGSRLSRIMDKRFSDWAAPKLRSLADKGLVAVHDERSGQKLYRLTEAGRRALGEQHDDR